MEQEILNEEELCQVSGGSVPPVAGVNSTPRVIGSHNKKRCPFGLTAPNSSCWGRNCIFMSRDGCCVLYHKPLP